MPKKILLIENDPALAGQLTESLEASGFDVRVAPEGKAGLDLAREWGPSAIVLCVELPGMSGYLVCQKLRKDDATKGIPLVLTSAEATADTFEKHRALKVRADEYLLKPFTPGTLLEKLASVGLPAEAPAGSAEDLVSLDEEMGLEALGGEPGSELPSLDLDSQAEEPAPPTEPAETDEDLALLDEAFDGIAVHQDPPSEGKAKDEPPEPPAAAPLFHEEEERPPAEADIAASDSDTPLPGTREELEPPPPAFDLGPSLVPAAVRPPSVDALRAAGIPLLEPEPPPRPAPAPRSTLVGVQGLGRTTSTSIPSLRSPQAESAQLDRLQREVSETRSALSAREAEARQQRSRADEAARRAEAAESLAADREAELASVRARLEAITGQARKADQELKTAREDARRSSGELETLRPRLAEAERRAEEASAHAERADLLERELESTRTELLVARSEMEGARGEVDARNADLHKRVEELEAQSAKNEERVFKAYQKIKGDEKVRDKVRKAIAIAAQLLEEGLPAEPTPPPPEKPRLS